MAISRLLLQLLEVHQKLDPPAAPRHRGDGVGIWRRVAHHPLVRAVGAPHSLWVSWKKSLGAGLRDFFQNYRIPNYFLNA